MLLSMWYKLGCVTWNTKLSRNRDCESQGREPSIIPGTDCNKIIIYYLDILMCLSFDSSKAPFPLDKNLANICLLYLIGKVTTGIYSRVKWHCSSLRYLSLQLRLAPIGSDGNMALGWMCSFKHLCFAVMGRHNLTFPLCPSTTASKI